MAYSDLNYAPPKVVKAVLGLTDGQFTKLAAEGKFKLLTRYKRPLVHMDSIAGFYEDRENIVLKKWGYDYESPRDKYNKMLQTVIKGFPRCFFKADIPEGYYRAFYNREALKLCVYAFDGYVRCICFSREWEHQLEQLYIAIEEGKVDIED